MMWMTLGNVQYGPEETHVIIEIHKYSSQKYYYWSSKIFACKITSNYQKKIQLSMLLFKFKSRPTSIREIILQFCSLFASLVCTGSYRSNKFTMFIPYLLVWLALVVTVIQSWRIWTSLVGAFCLYIWPWTYWCIFCNIKSQNCI